MAMKLRVRASALCLWEGKLLVVCLRDPVSKCVRKMPPGGAIEKGESPEQTAIRETLEETGFTVKLVPKSKITIEYPFVWAGEVHACRTHFYRAQVHGEARPVSVSEEFVQGTEWVPLSELKQEWAFHPQLRDALLKLLSDDVQGSRKPSRKKA